MKYFLEIDGSKAAVKAVKATGILVDHTTSNGLGGGAGAGQLCGICSAPWKPLESAITTDTSPLGTVYRFAAGRHGSMNITPLETAEAVAAARNILRAGNKKRRRA